MWRQSTLEHQYINEVFAPEDAVLQNIRSELRTDNKEGMNVDPYEGKFLQMLISLGEFKKIVEVGTLYGYSTLWLARALPQDGELISIESRPEHYQKAQQLLSEELVTPEVRSRIRLIHASAEQALQELSSAPEALEKSDGAYDVVFIDANKSGYLRYLDWAEKNVRTGGLIIGDNTFLFGHVVGRDRGVEMPEQIVKDMKEFNRRLADPSRYQSVLIPTYEGMTIARKI